MPRPRVVVVDDEAGVLRMIDRVLAPQCEVHAFRRPTQALAVAGEESFDLGILDIQMPEMDGFELMAQLGNIQPHLDVILMTGSVDERDARLVRAIREKAFFFLTKPFDREVLLTLVHRCLDAHRLDAENRAHVLRLEHELRAAQVFQLSLLPERSASRGGLEVALLYEPCSELCGDYCDYVLRDGEPGALIVADVAGHGAPAAMFAGMIKQAFRGAEAESYAPGVILQRILTASRIFGDSKHLTAMCVRIQPGSKTLEYVNAGHPPGLLLRKDGTMACLESSAPLIHPSLPEWSWEQRVTGIGKGDQLLLYTDGLLEALSVSGEEFGLERLERTLHRLTGGTARPEADGSSLLRGIREELSAFTEGRPLADDLTLLLARSV
jgi:phosphoserine phosphatase RsbU/P